MMSSKTVKDFLLTNIGRIDKEIATLEVHMSQLHKKQVGK